MTTALFIHSTGTLPLMWDAFPAESLDGLSVVKPSNIGYPPNDLLERGAPFSVEEDIQHVLAQVPEDGSKVHVLAHSYGGLIALKLLPLLGPRIASLYLFEPVLFGALPHSEHAARAAVDEAVRFRNHDWFLHDETRGGGEEWIELFIDYWNRPGSWSRMPEHLKTLTRAVGWKMFQEVRAVFDDTLRFEHHVVDVPLTLVKAARSPAGARAMVDELARLNPHATVTDLSSTGHLAPLTHPDLFASTVAEHLTAVGVGGAGTGGPLRP